MHTETSSKNRKDQKSEKVSLAIGKGKGESGLPEPWLQDVFSDSANPEGKQKKTSRPFESEQGKGAQLEGDHQPKSRKSMGGRKKLDRSERKSIKLQLHVTAEEFSMLENQHRMSGRRFLSDFLRALILDQKQMQRFTDQVELIKKLDMLGTSLGKIGNNINQLAKYANIQLKTRKMDPRTLDRYNLLMEQYLKEQRELSKAYRALARK